MVRRDWWSGGTGGQEGLVIRRDWWSGETGGQEALVVGQLESWTVGHRNWNADHPYETWTI